MPTFARLLNALLMTLRLATVTRSVVPTFLSTLMRVVISLIPLPLLLMRRPSLLRLRLLRMLFRCLLLRSGGWSLLDLLPRRGLSNRRRWGWLRNVLGLRRRHLLNRLGGDIEIEIIIGSHKAR
jgi:hypothetical protein